jgi:rSAM/selenodomain-associated transferase 1
LTLVVFARAAVPGAVKTRLAKQVGDEAALTLHRAFVDDACATAAQVGERRVLCVAGEPSTLADAAARHGLLLEEQAAGDLGARMDAALAAHAAHGPVCIIGSDSPSLPAEMVRDAFARLRAHDVVLGPSADGGYWLIGTRRSEPELFANIAWSTPSVLPETLRRLEARRCALLPFWYDVDDADGLRLLAAHLRHLPAGVAPATRAALSSLHLLY